METGNRPRGLGLVLVDMQNGFSDPKWSVHGVRNNFILEKNVEALLEAFRRHGHLVAHVRHDSTEADSPLRNGSSGFNFFNCAMPAKGEEVFTKRAHSAFLGTGLERWLRWKNITRPVFAGLTTDHCVSTSVRVAHDLGFHPGVVSDATATFGRKTHFGNLAGADLVHELALASLDGEFGRVVTAAQLKFELDQSALTLATARSETVALKNLS